MKHSQRTAQANVIPLPLGSSCAAIMNRIQIEQ
jgi:hypothetical protein